MPPSNCTKLANGMVTCMGGGVGTLIALVVPAKPRALLNGLVMLNWLRALWSAAAYEPLPPKPNNGAEVPRALGKGDIPNPERGLVKNEGAVAAKFADALAAALLMG